MKRYRCLSSGYHFYTEGIIYNGNFKPGNTSRTPESLNIDYPDDWQLILDDEIIGYKLKDDCKQYKEAARIIATAFCDFNKKFNINANAVIRWKDAKVLDLWFEPVYAPKYTLPKINGYEGKYRSDQDRFNKTVEYGCAVINIQWLRNIYKLKEAQGCSGVGNRSIKSIKISSDVEITMDEIKQIVEYFDYV